MHARAEGDMAVGLAAGIEAVGLGELRGIAVGRTDADMDVGAGRQPLAADLEVGRQAAVAELVGALEAQPFLDAALQQPGVLAQPPQLVGKAQQRVDRVADQVGRRLVAGVQQEDAVLHQLLVAQPLAVDFAVDQRAQHVAVVGRPPAALGHEAVEIGREFGDRRIARRLALAGRRRARARPGWRANSGGRARARPAARPACRRSPRPGRRKAKSSTRSMRPLSACWAEQPVDHGLDARLQVGERARREGRRQELAHARVQRRVVEHQAGRVMAIERRADAELGAELGLLVGAHAGVAVADRDVGVAREEDAAVGQALQRREAAQRVIVGERIVEEGGLERRQVEAPGEGLGLVRRAARSGPRVRAGPPSARTRCGRPP